MMCSVCGWRIRILDGVFLKYVYVNNGCLNCVNSCCLLNEVIYLDFKKMEVFCSIFIVLVRIYKKVFEGMIVILIKYSL